MRRFQQLKNTYLLRFVTYGLCALPSFAIAKDTIYTTSLPQGAVLVFETQDALGDFATNKFTLEEKPVFTARAPTNIRAWRVDNEKDYLSILDTLVAKARNSGFQMVYECVAKTCGGFDFRYGLRTAPMPQFHVDLSKFGYAHLENGALHLDFLVSVFAGDIYIQERVSNTLNAQQETVEISPDDDVMPTEPSIESLDSFERSTNENSAETQEGESAQPRDTSSEVAPNQLTPPMLSLGEDRMILEGLVFASGASTLTADPLSSLDKLAKELRDRPQARVYLVGHSDNTGSLTANKSLSQARAEAVKSELVSKFQIDNARIMTDGVGFLAPIATNATETGKATNRRVEAVFIE